MTIMEAAQPIESELTYSSAIKSAVNYSQWIIDILGPYLSGNILEIGFGHGGYIDLIARYGKYHGLDIDPSAVKTMKKEYPDYNFMAADIMKDQFPDQIKHPFDSIVCMNVLEHIEDDFKAFNNLCAILKPGGKIAILVPAMPALYSDMDKLAGHYRRYTLSRLEEFAEQGPVAIDKLFYFNPIGALGWYVNKFRSYQSLDDSAINDQIVFFDKYVLPVSRVLSPCFQKFFGQSAIMVATKEQDA